MCINWSIVANVFWGSQLLVGAVCIIFLLLILNNSEPSGDRGIIKTVIAYLSFNLVLWIVGLLFLISPFAYVILGPLMLFSFLICPVLVYRIVYDVTITPGEKRFPRWHYAAPVILTVVWALITQFIPFEARVAITENFNRPSADFPLLTHYFTSMVPHTILFQVVYIPLSLFRFQSYRRNYRQDTGDGRNYRMVWVMTMIVLSIMIALRAFIALINVERSIYVAPWNLILGCVILMSMEIVLTVNVLRRNYPPRRTKAVVISGVADTSPEEKEGKKRQKTILRKKDLDAYFRSEKPYLDPGLSMDTVSSHFSVNRVVLSAFVNKKYGINFNAYVNRWRLSELERLTKMARNKNKPIKDLLGKAGFGSYDTYRRTLIEQGKEAPDGR